MRWYVSLKIGLVKETTVIHTDNVSKLKTSFHATKIIAVS
jgi:hypothetical protein